MPAGAKIGIWLIKDAEIIGDKNSH